MSWSSSSSLKGDLDGLVAHRTRLTLIDAAGPPVDVHAVEGVHGDAGVEDRAGVLARDAASRVVPSTVMTTLRARDTSG